LTRALSVKRAPWGNMYEFNITFTTVAVGVYLVLLALKKNIRWLGLPLVTTVLLDLTTDLIAVREAGDGLSEAELVGTLLLMLVAGHETTLNLITNAVRALLAHPDQLRLVLDGAQPWSAVVEETLRHDSPVGQFPLRYASEDIEVGDVVIRCGEALLASYAAAGRDGGHYPDADRFDLTRQPARHLSLGHGPHFCLGSGLARLEAETALRHLFARFPALALAEGERPEPIGSFVSNSVRTLRVTVRTVRGTGA
ncbi:cytochrome P450, partial [Kitasatospora sp. NPDC059827]|uniref:cytochrome P450 n=1 Tax=Kitasatospora sp. NPDC059827 TaxID=3346964 RepID=UPI00365DA0AB